MFDLRFFDAALLGTILLFALVPAAVLSLAIPYAVLRARDSHEHPDSQLGLKAALHYFLSVSILLFLTGLSVISVDLLTREDAVGGRGDDTQAIRTGVALACSGAAFAFLHFILLTGTDDRRNPIARRTFTGWRFAIHGLVVLTFVTLCLVSIIQQDFKWKTLKGFLAVLLVWFPSWIVHLGMLWVRATGYRPERLRVGDED
jgi:uncharacterized membrane protein SpoIIM required for sporulation